ncbi:hypothetical protein [Edaphobacter aggregans]|nr:hypothetical protein [Edaphobacter aggregans]
MLMVATEDCAELFCRVTLEGRSEQLAYWPGLTGVQLRVTVPV